MRTRSFIPIGRVIPWRIRARYRRSKFKHLGVGENLAGRMRGLSCPQWLSLPMNYFCGPINIFRVRDASGISKCQPSFRRRERQDKWQRKPCKHCTRQQRAESRGAKRSSRDAAEAESTEQKNEGQRKHRRFRQVAEAERCAKSRKLEPVAPAAPDAKQQRGEEIHQHGNAKVRRNPGQTQPKVTSPEEK